MQEPQSSTGTVAQPLSEKTTHHEVHSTEDSTPFVQGNQNTVPLQSPPNTQASHSPTSPNGGALAWLQVAASFCIFLNTWGIVNMYGVFQTYYTYNIAETSTNSAISWIGSIQVFLLCFIGTVIGPIYDAGHLHLLLVSGTFLTLLGVFMTSLCKNYWQLFLAQGVVTGSGFGCLFLPGVTIVSQYFSTKKAFATGIASLGSSIGGVVYPIVWTQLQPKVGFGWATRVIGFIILATLILPLVVMRPLQYPKTRRSLLDIDSLKDVPYIFFGSGILFGYMGIYVVFFYIQLYAMDRAGMSSYLAFYLPALINAGSSLGRILPNFAADYVGTLNMQMIFAFASAVLSLSLIAIRNVQGILAFCVLYGFFTGTFVSLPAPTVASLSTNMASLGGRMSMAFITAGVGSLIGSPIAGAILSTNGGNNWNMLQVWSGVLLILSTLSMLGARTAKVGAKLNAKV
ncbi:monocarboxylate permease-like protein [Cenococcum geophilum 1.58]|uniref:Monocarboxylate permease-like protein n=1 Tax=Cenococcum geophilum 1.58 TaxID=794803 RepID=A0ACC8EP14_9PEZI|nr:monocarboxylate permease-like protein [Cenococcum geophilum 1.58]